jgi:hypothetical protein
MFLGAVVVFLITLFTVKYRVRKYVARDDVTVISAAAASGDIPEPSGEEDLEEDMDMVWRCIFNSPGGGAGRWDAAREGGGHSEKAREGSAGEEKAT